MKSRTSVTVYVALALTAAAFGMLSAGASRVGGEHAASMSAGVEEARGPHGGRLLRDDDFAVEITIFAVGVPPEFRVYSFSAEQPVDPAKVDLAVQLLRFGGRVDEIHFRPRENYLLGDREVEEPHSFAVKVTATYAGRTRRWEYESWEGRTEISPEAAAGSGITIEIAGPATVRTRLRLNGRIVPNEDRLAHVAPRYAGVVLEARKRLGERVAKGDVLAVIESNESLRPYEIRSPIGGTVIGKDVTPGEFADGEDVLYAVADLASVWVDAFVRPEDFARLKLGQEAVVSNAGEPEGAIGRIAYLSPVGSAETQMLLARVELPNGEGRLRPGLFVTAEVVVDEAAVPVAVRTAALQTFRDWNVVFLTDGRIYQAMPVEIGRRDEEWSEILRGVSGGQRYAAQGSFVVKADVGKSVATHED
jgi:cobalt-zinc-cadmium efflux system membrane fusion protein